jgi:F-type H+-transporting ATPase subunit delta
MHKDSHQSSLATAYAEALLELANESNAAAAIGEELAGLRQIVDADEQLAQLLADPAISAEERGQFLHRVFDGRASTLMGRFLGLLNEKDRLVLLPKIADAYHLLLEQQQGIVEVEATVAQGLGDEQLEAVRRTVGDALKRRAVVHQQVDPAIIGGLVLRVQDQLIDGSVRAQLSAMRRQLLDARPGYEGSH